jgi:hypothetical protein
MARVEVPINGIDPDYRSQLEYALSFADEAILSYRINDANSVIEAEVSAKADRESVTRKIRELVQRYEKRELGLAKTVDYKNERDLPPIDAWGQLLERKWVTPVGQGHVILRGPASQLMSLINSKIEKIFVDCF